MKHACEGAAKLRNHVINAVKFVGRVLQNSESYNVVGTCHGMSNLQMLEYQLTCHGMSLHHTGRITTIDRFCNTLIKCNTHRLIR